MAKSYHDGEGKVRDAEHAPLFPDIHPMTGPVEPRLFQKAGVGKSRPSRWASTCSKLGDVSGRPASVQKKIVAFDGTIAAQLRFPADRHSESIGR
jgi:hypothetical protein